MHLSCVFGFHKWDGSKCAKCGKIRLPPITRASLKIKITEDKAEYESYPGRKFLDRAIPYWNADDYVTALNLNHEALKAGLLRYYPNNSNLPFSFQVP
ncbi:hypothetical protein DSCO28_67350 [Desulfosarcina ovata subsp. sediminis]|uniref:Uncharacterized protein n=1 Tax=Desulfosarcina ovata subsp. sediminis TaxID=885957 RepID=A0A5K8A0S7_9BACT|nr:hypothetical protein DSCO28_67350 [Desulfosarcina ovata subsp. sediminis]